MQDSRELHEPFMKELKALLRKYDVDIHADLDLFYEPEISINFNNSKDRTFSMIDLHTHYIDGTED